MEGIGTVNAGMMKFALMEDIKRAILGVSCFYFNRSKYRWPRSSTDNARSEWNRCTSANLETSEEGTRQTFVPWSPVPCLPCFWVGRKREWGSCSSTLSKWRQLPFHGNFFTMTVVPGEVSEGKVGSVGRIFSHYQACDNFFLCWLLGISDSCPISRYFWWVHGRQWRRAAAPGR